MATSYQYTKFAGCSQIPVLNATLVESPTPGTGNETKTPQTPAVSSTLKYIYIAQNDSAVYLLRNDGIVDRSTGNGRVTQRMVCADPKVHYVAVACATQATYLIRSDGQADRSSGSGTISATVSCPDEGVTFIAGSGADSNICYMVGSNGNIYRLRSNAALTQMPCTAGNGVVWTTASGGINRSYFLRSDGRIQYTCGSSKIEDTIIECQNDTTGLGYLGISSQMTVNRGGKGEDYSNQANYFVRADGTIDRTTGAGKNIINVVAPNGLTYLAVTAGREASYFIRSDGAVDRTTKTNGKVTSTMNPPPGTKYVQASAGGKTYVLRSDGVCDRTSSSKVLTSMQPTNEPLESNSSCFIM